MAADETGGTSPEVAPADPTGPPSGGVAAPGPRLRAGTWRRSLVGFLLLFGILGVWSVSQPRWAAPDEPAQAIHAAGAADGQIFGKNDPSQGASTTTFIVPKALGATGVCFAFKPTVPANCEPQPGVTSARVLQSSYVGRYPPLYYVLVGLPSRLDPSSPRQLYYMRLVSAALSALFLTAALVSASQVRGRRWVLVGAAATVTPMVVFLGSVINPSGLEISTALCTWTSGLALFDGPEPRYHRRLVVWTAAAAGTFVQVRGLSPVLLALLAVALVALVGWRKVLAVLRRRDAQVALGVVGLCGLFAVVWILTQNTLSSSTTPSTIPVGTSAFHDAFTRDNNVHEMVGVFGWLDTFLPLWTYRVWEALLWVLLALALLRRRWRPLVVAVGLALVTVFLLTALSLHEQAKFGLVGQARYSLPLAVGIPIIVCYAAASRRARVWSLLAVLAAVAMAVVQFVAFLAVMRRNRTGVGGSFFTLHAPWEPALPWIVGVLAILVLETGFVLWWLLQLQGPRRGPRLRRPPVRVPAGVA